MNRHVTQPPIFHPWFYGTGTVVDLIVGVTLSSRFTDLWLILLSWVGTVVIGAAILVLLHNHFLSGEIFLTEQGIQEERRWDPAQTSWTDIIQGVALETQNTRVLALLRSGGSPMKSGEGKFWFFLRNPRKVIFLPDDKFTRFFVEAYYGPLDLELSK